MAIAGLRRFRNSARKLVKREGESKDEMRRIWEGNFPGGGVVIFVNYFVSIFIRVVIRLFRSLTNLLDKEDEKLKSRENGESRRIECDSMFSFYRK